MSKFSLSEMLSLLRSPSEEYVLHLTIEASLE